ncbi:PQQ-binding-like beta-propeller repeat protein [Gammaproteobacteria bacterium]|nr:PQQ-binding-like beta-propeller repeat protein [Gammaproteobacteria bacterium]
MKYFLHLLIIIFLSSCSSIPFLDNNDEEVESKESRSLIDTLTFWNNGEEEIDLTEPKSLIEISNQEDDITINWKISLTTERKALNIIPDLLSDGENTLGSFLPGFSGKTIFFANNNGSVGSYDQASGIENWTVQVPPLSSGVSAGFGVLIVASDQGELICLSQDDGSTLWSVDAGGEVLAQAAIDARLVLVKTSSGELNAYNISDGTKEWSYRSQLPSLTLRGSSPPLIEEGIVYAAFDNGRLGAFQIETGFLLWDGAISYVEGTSELENMIDADSAPVLEGGLLFVANYQGQIAAFDPAQRRIVWAEKTSSFYSPVITKGVIAVIQTDSTFNTYAAKTLMPSWTSDDYYLRDLSNPDSYKGNIVVGDFEGYIHFINPLNGKTRSRLRLTKNPIKNIIARADNIYAVDQEFNLYSISL